MTTEKTKLINTIVDRIKTEKDKHPFIDWEIFAAQKIYDTLITYWQEKTRWIPVEERLPVKPSRTRQILGKDKHTVSVVFISCSDEGYLNSIESLKREFTHWKEIDLAF